MDTLSKALEKLDAELFGTPATNQVKPAEAPVKPAEIKAVDAKAAKPSKKDRAAKRAKIVKKAGKKVVAPVKPAQQVAAPKDNKKSVSDKNEPVSKRVNLPKMMIGEDHPRYRILKKYAEQRLANAKTDNKNSAKKPCCRSTLPKNYIINTNSGTPFPKEQKKHFCTCTFDGKNCGCGPKPVEKEIIYITQADFKCGGIELVKSAHYKLACDIVFSPKEENTTAITINASNVILDFGIHGLTQGNTTPLTYGILVLRDHDRVKITGEKGLGYIKDFTLAGIRVLGRTNYVTIENIIVEQSVPNQYTNDQIPALCSDLGTMIVKLGIAVGEGDFTGVHMQNTSINNLVKDLTISNVVVKGSFVGIQIISTFGVLYRDSVVTECTFIGFLIGPITILPGDGEFGFYFPTAGDIVMDNNRFERNTSNNQGLANPEETYFFEFLSASVISQVTNITVTNTYYHDNSSGTFIIACDHDRVNNARWENVHVTKTIGIAPSAWHISGSIPSLFSGTSCFPDEEIPILQNNNLTLNNCTVQNVFSISEEYVFSGITLAYITGATLTNCHCQDVNGVAGGAYGFRIAGETEEVFSEGITLINCTAQCNGTKEGVAGAGGFNMDNVTRRVVFRNCVANNNATAESILRGAGFYIDGRNYGPNNIISNIDIDNCTINNNGNGAERTGGVYIRNRAPGVVNNQNIAIQNSKIKFNNGSGIYCEDISPGLTINSNEIYQNTGAGINIINNPAPAFVSRNVAYANTPDYLGVPPLNIVNATTAALPATSVGMRNVSITPI